MWEKYKFCNIVYPRNSKNLLAILIPILKAYNSVHPNACEKNYSYT